MATNTPKHVDDPQFTTNNCTALRDYYNSLMERVNKLNAETQRVNRIGTVGLGLWGATMLVACNSPQSTWAPAPFAAASVLALSYWYGSNSNRSAVYDLERKINVVHEYMKCTKAPSKKTASQ